MAWYLGTQQIATHFKTIISLLKASARSSAGDEPLTVAGLDRIERNMGLRGIVIVAPHAGPYPTLGLIASRWFRRRGFRGEIVVVARLFRPFRSGALMDWFVACFARAGVTILPVDAPAPWLGNRLKKVLEDKGIVVLFIDEPTRTPSLPIPFFDGSIDLPVGPARIARATNSVIVPCMATYGRSRRVTLTIAEPIEPAGPAVGVLRQIAGAFEMFIGQHLDQWSMLTPIWVDSRPAPPGHSYADLHLHTVGSDGFCTVDDWVAAARDASVAVIAVTDHDHIETIRAWKAATGPRRPEVLAGVELTARGRIVHLGVLFPDELPASLPRPGTPLVALVRWARAFRGSVIILVHPLPALWRWQIRRLARADALPDALETRFPLVGWRNGALERAAAKHGLATVGGSDAHLSPRQFGRHVTAFPGESVADLLAALRQQRTVALTLSRSARLPLAAYLLQALYSWLFPFRRLLTISRLRLWVLRRARGLLSHDRRAIEPDISTELSA